MGSKQFIREKRFVLIIMFLLIGLISCNDIEEPIATIPEEGDTLSWNISYMPRRFYPSMMLSHEEKQVVINLYEGLTLMTDDELSLGMAEQIDISDDGLTYDVILKKAQWSDARLVTTDDFIYSWERNDNFLNDINLLYYDAMIKNVEVIDENRLIIHLYQENDALLSQLSMVAFMPVRRDVIDVNKEIPTFISDVTNGPYYLKNYRMFGGITLTKNVHYYDYYLVKIDEIIITLNNNFSSVYQSFKDHKLDFVQGIDHNEVNNLIQNEDDFKIYDQSGVYCFAINANHDALRDVRIRRMLTLSIDRSELNPFQNIIRDSVAFSVIDYDMIEAFNSDDTDLEAYYPVMKPHVEIDKVQGINVALGTGYLEALNGLRVVTRDNPNDIRIAELLVTGWENFLGVTFVIEPKDRYDYAYALKTDDYEIILNNQYQIEDNVRYSLKHFFGNTKLNSSEFDSYTFNQRLIETVGENDTILYETFKDTTDELDTSSKMISLFKLYEPVLMSSDLNNWSMSYEKLFYFGRAVITVSDKEDSQIE